MSTPSPAAQATAPTSAKVYVMERVKPYLAPYYLVFAALMGAITVGFVVVTVLIVLVVTNFNVLALIE